MTLGEKKILQGFRTAVPFRRVLRERRDTLDESARIALILSREIDRHVLQTAAGVRVPIAEARHVPLGRGGGWVEPRQPSIIFAFAASRMHFDFHDARTNLALRGSFFFYFF